MSARLEVKVPFENVNDPTARIVSWAFASGATVKEGDVIAELENSKTTFQVSAPGAGVVEYSAPVGEEVAAGDILFYIQSEGQTVAEPPVALPPAEAAVEPLVKAVEPRPVSPPVAVSAAPPVFSRKASRLIEELGLDANVFTGMTMVQESDVRQKFSLPNGTPKISEPAGNGNKKPAALATAAKPPSARESMNLRTRSMDGR